LKYEFQSSFAGRIKDMLEYRAALGRSTIWHGWTLANFDRFCLNRFPSESKLTKEIALAWCGAANGNSGYRASTIREFGKYLILMGEDAFVLPPSFFPSSKAGLPYIFTDCELRRFFDASDRFPPCQKYPLLEYTVAVIFRLQYACGMRPQEVRLLRRADFNFGNCTIYIAEAKHCKDRRLAVTSDVMNMCRKYDILADATTPGRVFFFQSPSGGAYSPKWLSRKFHQCWKMSGNGNERGTCTPYDARHNFATRTLMRWVEEGRDLNAMVPYLSAYMGHAAFSATFYYVHLLPERLSRMNFTRADGIIPEVSYDEKIQ
jgi:integrase